MALVPFFFGLQQFIEGFVWLSMNAGDSGRVHIFSLMFILFIDAITNVIAGFK